MQKDELSQILEAVRNQPKQETSNKDLIDNLSKVGVALCVAGIMWVGNQIQALDRKMITVETNQLYQKQQLDDVTQFTKDPRFTRSDNEIADQKLKAEIREEIRLVLSGVNDLRNEQKNIVVELGRRTDFMSKTEDALDKIIDRLRELEDR